MPEKLHYLPAFPIFFLFWHVDILGTCLGKSIWGIKAVFLLYAGKSSTALALAQHYSVACLSIDSVVLEAISDGNSRAGLRVRQLCAKAAMDQLLQETEEAGKSITSVWASSCSLNYKYMGHKNCLC